MRNSEIFLICRALVMALLVTAGAFNAAEGSLAWNQLRGPGGSGIAQGNPPLNLADEQVAWKVAVGAGLSSPVVWSDKVFMTQLEGERLVTVAFDCGNGQELWRKFAPKVPFEKVHRTSSPVASTPYVDAERLYVYFGSYGLLCYDHEGNELWKKPIKTPRSLYGMSTSPIVRGDHLILVLDDDSNLEKSKLSRSRVVALSSKTGEQIWETARPFVRSGWSTPVLWKHDKGEELVVLGSGRVYGYDATTGEEKWYATGFSRETISMPVTGDGKVYISSAMLGGVSDEHPDPLPFWNSVMLFDQNKDEKLDHSELTHDFTFPFRPELEPGHPGYGLPLPKEAEKRKKRQVGIFGWVDKDRDGFWTKSEFLAHMSFRRGKPRLMAIRPGGEGDITDSDHVGWQLNRSIPEIPSPLFHDKRIYMVRNGGMFSAVGSGDGALIYSERLGAPGQYSASPVLANEHVYLLSNRGIVTVVKPGDAFEKVHQYDLKAKSYVTPAFDQSTIYIRTDKELIAFRREN